MNIVSFLLTPPSRRQYLASSWYSFAPNANRQLWGLQGACLVSNLPNPPLMPTMAQPYSFTARIIRLLCLEEERVLRSIQLILNQHHGRPGTGRSVPLCNLRCCGRRLFESHISELAADQRYGGMRSSIVRNGM